MAKGGKVLGLIPARGGSKGLPRKNIKMLAGKPLIAWTIEAAHQALSLDRTVLSSEDPEIMDVAAGWGCEVPFVRPDALAQDDTAAHAVVSHAIEQLPGYEWLVWLQPTSPLRRATDIDAAVRLCIEHGYPSVVSVTALAKSATWMFRLGESQKMIPLVPHEKVSTSRQQAEPVFALNGAIYVVHIPWFRKTGGFIGEHTRGYVMEAVHAVDIDDEEDFDYALSLIRRREATSGSRVPPIDPYPGEA